MISILILQSKKLYDNEWGETKRLKNTLKDNSHCYEIENGKKITKKRARETESRECNEWLVFKRWERRRVITLRLVLRDGKDEGLKLFGFF